MIGILTAVAVGYGGLIAFLYVAQRSLMYHPSATLATPAASGVPEMTAVSIETEDGLALVSWYRAATRGAPTLVYFHGNAGAISDRGAKARFYLDAGFGLFLTGYRAYGGNPGSPTEQGLYADAAAALGYLEDSGIESNRLILYGESLGTGVAVEIARRMSEIGRPVAAVVLEAPFTTMGDAAGAHYPYVPARFLVRDSYDSLAKIEDIGAPLLIVHGDRDAVVPFKLGKRLFEAARQPKEALWISGAGHDDLYEFGAAAGIFAFIDSYLP